MSYIRMYPYNVQGNAPPVFQPGAYGWNAPPPGPPPGHPVGPPPGPPPGPRPDSLGYGYSGGLPPPPQGYQQPHGYQTGYQSYPPNGYPQNNIHGYQNDYHSRRSSYVPPPVPPAPTYNRDQNRPPVPPPQQYQLNPDSFHAVPSQTQLFGQGLDLHFRYSQCTRRKKGLIIGCNYIGKGNLQLSGCINDANTMRLFIVQNFGYKEDDIVFLTDDQQSPGRQPTKANILRAMQWLVKDAQPNDSLFFHFSGHGGVTEDLDGDEDDGYDSTIYPVDFQQAGPIIDDQMHDILVKPLPIGCRLTALYDCCHSGTALDLPYVYLTKGVIKEPNLLKFFGQDGLDMVSSYAAGDIKKTIDTGLALFNKVAKTKSKEERENIKRMKASLADVISISGCKDDQTSADAKIDGRSSGAMTYAFVTVLSSNPNQSYLSLLNNMRSVIAGRWSQKPQLSSSHPMDVYIRFIM